MKYEGLIYFLSSIAVIIGAFMKVLHLPYANVILLIAFIVTVGFQTWLVGQLKKRIKELENKD